MFSPFTIMADLPSVIFCILSKGCDGFSEINKESKKWFLFMQRLQSWQLLIFICHKLLEATTCWTNGMTLIVLWQLISTKNLLKLPNWPPTYDPTAAESFSAEKTLNNTTAIPLVQKLKMVFKSQNRLLLDISWVNTMKLATYPLLVICYFLMWLMRCAVDYGQTCCVWVEILLCVQHFSVYVRAVCSSIKYY